jgi:hypothetical protein
MFMHKWEDKKKHLQETGHEIGLDSSGSAGGPAAGSCKHTNAQL